MSAKKAYFPMNFWYLWRPDIRACTWSAKIWCMHDKAGIWSPRDQNSRSTYGYDQPCSSYECHLTYGAVFGLSNRNFLTIWLEWSKSLNLIMCSDGVNIFKISNVTALTARLLPIVKLRTRSRSRSGEGQEGQIWTLAVLYFWFSPEHGRL